MSFHFNNLFRHTEQWNLVLLQNIRELRYKEYLEEKEHKEHHDEHHDEHHAEETHH